ncbi:MAG: beta-lactamase family protein [Bacteroidia bacterium]|nr:beta-lactamase family protein [Bacteroidia bacterium]
MKTTLLPSLILILCLMSCESQSPNLIKKIDDSSISVSELDQKIQFLVAEANVTGLGVSILNAGSPVYQKAFGYSNIETKDSLKVDHVFYGASFSKAVFAYLVAQMAEEKIIQLDKPIDSQLDIDLPDLPIEKKFRRLHDLKEDERHKLITPRMSLAHTTGFSNWRWLNEPDKKLRIHSNPGTRYSYSGEGVVLTQWAIEYITGEKLEHLAAEMIFKPLEMSMSDYLWREDFEGNFCYGHTTEGKKIPKDIETEDATAGGSLSTTLVDYSKFISHLLKSYNNEDELTQLLFKPNIRIRSKAQFGPLANEETDENDDIELSYGLGWGLLKTPHGFGAFKEGHGEGFQHYSIMFPEKGIGLILMANSDNAESIFKELLEICIGDIYTPWRWENYIPYNLDK